MSASTMVDVIIGLVFVFFVCSLAVSGINEAVRKALDTRAKTLWTAIERILSEDDGAVQESQLTPRIGTAPTRSDPTRSDPTAPAAPLDGASSSSPRPLFQQVFDHPIIGRLDPARLNRPSRITHIPPTDFARALVDILTPDDGDDKAWNRIGEGIERLPPVLRSQFQLLYEEAGHDILAFRRAIEDWFENAMTRVSTWYKKRTRWAMLGYGAIVAIGLNVSAVHVTTELYENDVVRETVVDLAAAGTTSDGIADCDDRACVEHEVGKLVDTGLPLWWRDCPTTAGTTATCGFEDGRAVLGTIAGWLITAAALSLGASFWFALLKRAFRVRSQVVRTAG